MTASDLGRALARLGLSRRDREVYAAVLERGEATAAELAAATALSREAVADAATELAARGLVEAERAPAAADEPERDGDDSDAVAQPDDAVEGSRDAAGERGPGAGVDASAGATVLRARSPSTVADRLRDAVETFEGAASGRHDADPDGLPAAPTPAFERLGGPEQVHRRLRREVAAAEDELFAVLPGSAVPELADELAAAVDRGVTVYLLVVAPDVEAAVDDVAAGTHAHVVRSWGARPAVFLLRDGSAGVLGGPGALDGAAPEADAVAVRQRHVAGWLFGNAIGTVWRSATQRGLADPPPLPAAFEHFRTAVTVAALHDLEGTELAVDVEARDLETGEVVRLEDAPVREVRQNVVEPVNAAFPVEVALVVETDDGLVSVGGETDGFGPFHEDLAARAVTLRAVD